MELKNKKFGRKVARRSMNQTNWSLYEDYLDMVNPMPWKWDEIWDGDYDYWDDEDIYNRYWNDYKGNLNE